MRHQCPRCGRSSESRDWARVTCRSCGTSWNTRGSSGTLGTLLYWFFLATGCYWIGQLVPFFTCLGVLMFALLAIYIWEIWGRS